MDLVSEKFDFLIIENINKAMTYAMSRIILDESPEKMKEDVKTIMKTYKFSGHLTREQAISLGFIKWSDELDIYLLPVWMFCCIDTKSGDFYSIYGDKVKYTELDELSNDSRFGYLAYGIIPIDTKTSKYYYDKKQSLLYTEGILDTNTSEKNPDISEIYGLTTPSTENRIIDEVFIKYNDKKYYLQPDGSYKHFGGIK